MKKDDRGRNISGKSESEDKLRTDKREKKEDVREYDPNKDESCLIIGGYSTFIRKKEIAAKTA